MAYLHLLIYAALCGKRAVTTVAGGMHATQGVWGRPRAECWVDSPVRLRQPACTQAPKRALAAATGNEKTPPPGSAGVCQTAEIP